MMIGLADLDRDDVWTWTDGTPYDFDAWKEGSPNAGTADDTRCSVY